jgi:glycosyltransferase involved in cell wall biosynthesis
MTNQFPMINSIMNKEKKVKRIGIDARFYGPVGKGLGRYTKEVVDNIIKLDQVNEYAVFLRKENFADFKCDGLRVKKVPADIKWYGLAEQVIFPFYIWRQRLDLMHFPHFNVPIFCPVKFVVTIHDLILIKFPTARATTLGPFLYKIKNLAYRLVITLAVERARKILAVSQYTKEEVVRHFKIKPARVAVTYEGVANLMPPPARHEREGREEKTGENNPLTPPPCKKKNFLLYVGNAYPHKNLEGLIRVFARINESRPELKLVLVGKEDYFYRRLKQYAKNFPAKIIFTGYLPDAALQNLYSRALVYTFPSFYEGFGLPALEAMAFGLPVVSSNKTSLPEVLGQAALYFNPADEKDMQEKIELVIKDEKLRQDLKNRGVEQVKKYSWSDCAQKTLEIYKELLDN